MDSLLLAKSCVYRHQKDPHVIRPSEDTFKYRSLERHDRSTIDTYVETLTWINGMLVGDHPVAQGQRALSTRTRVPRALRDKQKIPSSNFSFVTAPPSATDLRELVRHDGVGFARGVHISRPRESSRGRRHRRLPQEFQHALQALTQRGSIVTHVVSCSEARVTSTPPNVAVTVAPKTAQHQGIKAPCTRESGCTGRP